MIRLIFNSSFLLLFFLWGNAQSLDNKVLDKRLSEAFAKLRTDSIEQGFNQVKEIKMILKERPVDSLLGEAYRISGEFYNSLGDFDNAIKEFLQAIEIFESIDYTVPLSSSYSGLGNSYFAISRYDKAKEYYLLSQKLAVQNNQMDSWARVSINLCNILIAEEEYQEALEMLDKAQTIFLELKKGEPAAIAYLMEANVYLSKGELKKAERFLEEMASNKDLKTNYYIETNMNSMRATVAAELRDLKRPFV